MRRSVTTPTKAARRQRSRPIRLHDHELRALLLDRLSRIRRPLKLPTDVEPQGSIQRIVRSGWLRRDRPTFEAVYEDSKRSFAGYCPFGDPGDLLWVQERWAPADKYIVSYERSPARWVWYACDDVVQTTSGARADRFGWPKAPSRWFSSTQLPRECSRFTLKIGDVRIERLREVTEESARREGILCSLHPRDISCPCLFGTVAHRTLWDDSYFGTAFAYDKNPLTWVLDVTVETFEEAIP